MQEKKENDAGQQQTDKDSIANTGNRFAHQLRLIVEGFEMHAWRQLAPQASNLHGDRIRDLHCIR